MTRFIAILCACLLGSPVFAQSAEDVAAARLAYLAGEHVESLTILRAAAEAGNPVAQNVMGNAYDNGNGVEMDMAQAIDWYERAAAQDFDKAIYNLGLIYSNGENGITPDYPRAIGYYDRAIALGYSFAMNNRARLHELGRGGAVDMQAALALYEQAAALDNPDAMNNLGLAHVRGEVADVDHARALEMFQGAAALGNARAISNLGAMYGNGYGVAQDNVASMALYMLAAQNGDAQAAINLAYDLIEGPEAFYNPDEGWGWCLAGRAWADEPEHDFVEDCDYLADQLSEDDKAKGALRAAELTQ